VSAWAAQLNCSEDRSGEKGVRSGWCSSGPAEDRVINAKQGLAPTDRDDCNTERSEFVDPNEHLREWNRLR
jgi:hypothetical protein